MSEALTAQRLVEEIAGMDIEALRAHHVELTHATADLARTAGMDWPWGHDDPTVALLRALARVALVAPEARSASATELHATLTGGAR